MLTNYPFYFSSIRNLTAAFGSMFNNIKIQRIDKSGSVESIIRVPISYGPADKTILMLQQQSQSRASGAVEVKIVLPRISFALTSMTYDTARKVPSVNKNITKSRKLSFNAATAVNTTNSTINIQNHNLRTGQSIQYTKGTGDVIGGLTDGVVYYCYVVNKNSFRLAQTKTAAEAGNTITLNSVGSGSSTFTTSYSANFDPIPYNFEFTLSIFVKYIDDGLQIIEQILPYFTPFYTITMNDLAVPDLKRDVTVNLTSVTNQDVYEGLVEEDRTIEWDLTFVASAWIYPPVRDTSVIKIAETNFFELDTDQKLVTTRVEVNPLDANPDDIYTIDTTFIENQ
jgi:hypothetical protein